MLDSTLLFMVAAVAYVTLLLRWISKKTRPERLFVFTVFYIYLVTVLATVFFPFPFQTRLLHDLRSGGQPPNNFIPFHDVFSMAKHDSLHDFLRQIGGNIVMFFPFGFLLPIAFKTTLKFKKAILIGIVSSVIIELGQLLIDVIIQYNYRTCDIDDVILNTTGFIIGFVIFKLLQRILPINSFIDMPSANS